MCEVPHHVLKHDQFLFLASLQSTVSLPITITEIESGILCLTLPGAVTFNTHVSNTKIFIKNSQVLVTIG
jgi:hypothetical protein